MNTSSTDDEHAPASTPAFEIDRATDGIEIGMKPGAVYAGNVVDAHDAPVPYAKVHLVRGMVTTRHGSADSSGAFEIRGLPRGSWMTHAESDDGVSKEAVVDLTNDLRGQKLMLDLVVDRSTGRNGRKPPTWRNS